MYLKNCSGQQNLLQIQHRKSQMIYTLADGTEYCKGGTTRSSHYVHQRHICAVWFGSCQVVPAPFIYILFTWVLWTLPVKYVIYPVDKVNISYRNLQSIIDATLVCKLRAKLVETLSGGKFISAHDTSTRLILPHVH
jgi:hypothetical protein